MELIDRAALLALINDRNINTCNGKLSCLQMKRMVESVPTVDAVPVVRCKDCVYFELDKENADLDNWYHFCQNLSCGVKKMDYCSFGERRE